jgi:hypothetical protein
MTNFNEHLFRVSSLNNIMAGAEFYKDLYDVAYSKQVDLYSKYTRYEAEYEAIKNKETKTAMAKVDQAEKARDAFYLQRKLADELKKDINKVNISEGCKTHLTDVWISRMFGRATKDIRSKYIEKGLQMEDTSILMYNVVSGNIFEKNTERKDDGFIMGEIDFDDIEVVFDVKSSWDIFTFFRNIKYYEKPESSPYYWNMQGYMKLWNKKKSKLVYSLVDTPEKLIENERKKLAYDFIGTDAMLEEAYKELELNVRYSDIPMNERIIEIDIERNDEDIAKIPLVVNACREYLNNLKSLIYKNRKYEYKMDIKQ